MKRFVVILLILCLILAGCTAGKDGKKNGQSNALNPVDGQGLENNDDNKDTENQDSNQSSKNPGSVQSPVNSGNKTKDIVTVDDRNLILEDIAENIAEETVIKDFLYTITAEFDSKYDILAHIEPHVISIESEKEQFNNGIYVRLCKIHKISTLTEKEYKDEQNPLCYYNWEEIVNKHDLSDYKIVNIDYTIESSGQAPQWGNGTYNRSFVVGKTAKDNSYKIFDFGMPRDR